MAEIDSLGSNMYFSGIQNATSEQVKKNQKNEKVKKGGKISFADLLHKDEEESNLSTQGLPPEIAKMSLDDAVIFLKDSVDLAGNDLSENLTKENVEKFKTSVRNFITFMLNNNFQVTSKQQKRHGHVLMQPSRAFFSNYSLPPHPKNPKYQIEVINKKLDELTRETIRGQMDNLKILAQVNEIKGLIVDLMSS